MSGRPAASSTVFRMMSSGTASSAPVVPHTQAQKLKATRISSGLMVSLRPTSEGVMMFASTRWIPAKVSAGSIATQGSAKAIRPPSASSSTDAIGPR